ncbi:hypothetical protein L7F22_026862 [Adiantum nelumboides]|nr:hypothetical protein [Adiantum nelumboides]
MVEKIYNKRFGGSKRVQQDELKKLNLGTEEDPKMVKVKQEIDKLLAVGFIKPIHEVTWLSPIIVVPKKNGKIRVCVDYRKLNAATITDPFPMPFCDTILDAVAGTEIYSFLDGFSGYNQIKVAEEDQLKSAFITDWGAFASTVMNFGLTNGPPSFNYTAYKTFEPYLQDFMSVFVDDFSVFGKRDLHLQHLKLCFERCRMFRLSLNPYKSIMAVRSGVLLGHVVSQDGMSIDAKKIEVIQSTQAPTNIKELSSASYYVTFIDDATRHVWVYAMKPKDETFSCFKKFFSSVETQSEHNLKALCSDNGREYVSKEFPAFCSSRRIKREFTAPYTPAQNGIAENYSREDYVYAITG